MSRWSWILFSLGLSLAVSGCRFSDPPLPAPWSESFAEEKALPASEPLAYRVGIAPLRLGFDPRDLYLDDPARHAS